VLVEMPFDEDWTELEFARRAERKEAGAESRTSSKIFLSRPRVLAISPDRDLLGSDLYNFMKQERRNYELRMIALACSFLSEDDPLLRATLVVSLERDDGITEDRPQAWNLQPRRLAKPSTRLQKSFSLEASFNPKARVDLSEQTSPEDDEHIVLGYGEGSSTPEWVFKRTSKHNFDGIHYLGMSAMIPRSIPSSAHLALSAKYSHRRLGIARSAFQIPAQLRQVPL